MKHIANLIEEGLEYARKLSHDENVLVWLRDNSPDYQAPTPEERWGLMRMDLQLRGERKANEYRGAYIDQIARRCRADIPLLDKLASYEARNNLDLSPYIDVVEEERASQEERIRKIVNQI